MIEPKDHKTNFTAEDIERYHTGKMTPNEMHLLEKAALDDPFLADALEGYLLTPTPTADANHLRQKLSTGIQEKKVVPLYKGGTLNKFLRIAALFILIAGLGWMVYQFALSNKNREMATSTTIVDKDTVEISNNTIAAPQAESNKLTKSEETEIAAAKPINKKTATQQSKRAQDVGVENKQSGFAPEEHQDAVSFSAPAAARKVATDDANSENADSFNIISKNDSSANNSIASAPSKKETVIVLQRAKNSKVPEVVLGKSRNDSTLRKPQIKFEEAEPADGQIFYDDYVAQNLQLPETEKIKPTGGEVKLSFDVNEDGQAVNIKVEKSLCAACDQEAVRILKEGPRLVKKKKNKKSKLSIRF